jgi:hypothetical protein
MNDHEPPLIEVNKGVALWVNRLHHIGGSDDFKQPLEEPSHIQCQFSGGNGLCGWLTQERADGVALTTAIDR